MISKVIFRLTICLLMLVSPWSYAQQSPETAFASPWIATIEGEADNQWGHTCSQEKIERINYGGRRSRYCNDLILSPVAIGDNRYVNCRHN